MRTTPLNISRSPTLSAPSSPVPLPDAKTHCLMTPRNRKSSNPDPFALIQELHRQLRKCDPLPPPWNAYQSDDPKGHNNLLKKLQSALRIPSPGLSRHVIPSADGAAPVEFFPDRVWSMKVMPSFRNYGLVAVFEGRSKVRCAVICKGDLPDKPDADYAVVDQFMDADQWRDPVLAVMDSIELAPTPDRSGPDGSTRLTLDGTSYSFRILTDAATTSIHFSNPAPGPYRKLAQACCDATKTIAKMAEHPQVSSFVNSWKSSLRRWR